MELKPIRRPLEEYLEEEFLEETPTVQDTPVELKVKAEDLEALAKHKQELSDLLDVRKIMEYERELVPIKANIGIEGFREYSQNKEIDIVITYGLGCSFGSMFAAAYVTANVLGWSDYISALSGLIILVPGFLAGVKLGKTIIRKSTKKRYKQFEEEKKKKLGQLNQEKENLEHKLSFYDINAKPSAIVMFEADKLAYSIGEVQSIGTDYINVRHEYDWKEGRTFERRKPIYEVKPDRIYVLSTSHELSQDDIKVIEDKTPIQIDSNGQVKFGFCKREGSSLQLYVNATCSLLSHTFTLEELDTATIKKLIPKLKNQTQQHPYR